MKVQGELLGETKATKTLKNKRNKSNKNPKEAKQRTQPKLDGLATRPNHTIHRNHQQEG